MPSSSVRAGLLIAPMMQLPTPLSHAARVMLARAMPVSVARSPGMEVSCTTATYRVGSSSALGAINKPALTELLGIEEPQKLAFMVAFGYPAHKAHIVPLTAETGVKYYLDENRDYCVPKRSKEEIAKYL